MLSSCDEAETSRGLCDSVSLPVEEVTYCKQSNNASYKTACESVMGGCCVWHNGVRLSAKRKLNIKGPTCITFVLFFLKNFMVSRWMFINLSTRVEIQSWYYKFAIWGTILYYCITLTLVTVTKLCFKMRKETLKGNIIHPVHVETPGLIQSSENWCIKACWYVLDQ